MDRIIAPDSVIAADADTAPSSGQPGFATDGDPGANKPATIFPAYAWNGIQEELVAAIERGGVILDRNDTGELERSITRLSAVNVGTLNAGRLLHADDAGLVEISAISGDVLVALDQNDTVPLGARFMVLRTDSTTNRVTIMPSGTLVLNLGAVKSVDLAPGQLCIVINGGTRGWFVLGGVFGAMGIFTGTGMPPVDGGGGGGGDDGGGGQPPLTAGILPNHLLFDQVGTTSWTVPDDVTWAAVTAISTGGYTGSGALACGIYTLTPASVIPVTISAVPSLGVQAGGSASFGSFLSVITGYQSSADVISGADYSVGSGFIWSGRGDGRGGRYYAGDPNLVNANAAGHAYGARITPGMVLVEFA